MAGRGEASESEEVLIAVAQGLQRSDPARALDMAEHGLACGFDHTELTLIRLRAAYEQGSREVLGYLDEVSVDDQTRAAAVGFGLDMRDLRWQSAASRPLGEEVAAPLTELALMLSGKMVEPYGESPQPGANARLVSSAKDHELAGWERSRSRSGRIPIVSTPALASAVRPASPP
jgi:hypothetical protein